MREGYFSPIRLGKPALDRILSNSHPDPVVASYMRVGPLSAVSSAKYDGVTMKKNILGLSLTALLVGSFSAGTLKAVTISTANLGTLPGPVTSSGTLANQGVALEATFSLSSAAQLTIFTTSYGGGMNASGTTAAPGGFMPSLVLYNGAGTYVAGETFPSPIGSRDPNTGLVGDAYIRTSTLGAGTYIVALSDFLVQQSPTATSLSDGFIDFGSGTTFTDVQGNLRTGNYSVNITGPSSAAAVPEPATLGLIGPALAGVAFWCYRRKKSRTSTAR